jgi:hypothetical protein
MSAGLQVKNPTYAQILQLREQFEEFEARHNKQLGELQAQVYEIQEKLDWTVRNLIKDKGGPDNE